MRANGASAMSSGEKPPIEVLQRQLAELQRENARLRQDNDLLQAILDSIPDIIGLQHPDHTMLCYNQAGYDFLGLRPAEVRGKKCFELIGRTRQCEPCATSDALASGVQAEHDTFFPDLGMHMHCRAVPVFDQDGRVLYLIEILRDITKQKASEEAIAFSERRFRSIIEDASNLAIQGYDSERRVVFWNRASEAIYGFTHDEALGCRLEDLIIPDHIRQEVVQAVTDWVEYGQKIPSGELVLKDKHDRDVPVLSSHVMIESLTGSKELFCIDVDLSEIKRIQAELIQAKEVAEAASRAKSEFLANMSHEIRTPLNGIMGMLQLMQTTSLDQDQQEYIGMAVKASKRLTRLLSDILDLSKIEAEKIEIRREEFQLAEVMQSIEDIFSQASRDNGNVLQVRFDPLIPDRLSGDKTRLTQILFNLVGNASKYTRQGMVEVEAIVLPQWDPGECRLLFAVQDSGVGISDHVLEQVFEPFAQGSESDSPYSRQYEGAGLGLPLVKRLVRLMHGSLSIDSRKGEGTTVYVSLPFDLPEGDEQRLEHKFP